MRVSVDGVEQHDKTIPLVDDHKEHWAEPQILKEQNTLLSAVQDFHPKQL